VVSPTANDLRRGRLVAEALAGAWRPSSAPLGVTAGALREIEAVLIGAGAGGLAWERVRGSALESTPAGDAFHQAYRHQALAYVVRQTRIAEVVEHLRRAGIEPIMGKGWAVARHYREPGLRPCGDVDLYVGRRDHEAAALALRGPAGDLVDLHCGFAELDDRGEAELRARSESVPVGAGTVRVFGPEDHLRLIALHALRHGLLRPLWLCDVAVVLESAGEGFDWDYFAGGHPRRAHWSFAALEAARQVLGACRQGLEAADRHRARLPSWVIPAVLREWGAPRPPHGARVPVAELLGRPREWWGALRLRWPNAIEATVGLGASFSERPRLPLQVGECVRRTAVFAFRRGRAAAAAAGIGARIRG